MFVKIGKSLVSVLVALGRAMPDIVRDVSGLAGVALIAYGAWLAYEPAGYIVAGVLLLIGVILSGFGQRAGN